jgi:diketogulonate reductase-like aldo/keto reductase
VLQVEFHPHYYNKSLLKFCNAHNIHLQAYSSLGGHSSEQLLQDPVVQEVARQAGHSVVQVLLKWALQQNVGKL